jgi:hypothetical protein
MTRAATTLAVLIPALLTSGGAAPAVDAPAWRATLGDLVKSEKAGYGGLCGVAVDPATGTVWVNLSDRGFYRSDDRAKTFRRAGPAQPKGRTETPGCLALDPTGATRRLAAALVYGAPAGVSADGGATWKAFGAASAHADWCALDWASPEPTFVLALRHESGGLLLASRDGGGTFREVGKGYATGWVFDGRTAVMAEAKTKERPRPNLVRTADGGVTWTPCGAYSPVGSASAQAQPKWHGGTLYWLVEGGLIASADRGATWKTLSTLKDARYGPVFGTDDKRVFVLTGAGVVESADGGRSWSKPVAPPEGLGGTGGLTWLAYDAKGDALYLMKMGGDLFKLERGPPARPPGGGGP